jgi:hypothetical protein
MYSRHMEMSGENLKGLVVGYCKLSLKRSSLTPRPKGITTKTTEACLQPYKVRLGCSLSELYKCDIGEAPLVGLFCSK